MWPAELSTVTAETAPLVKYLKADLQRIVNSANEELKNIRCAGLVDSTRQAEEARVINDARAFAVRRVESTVRHLHNMKSKLPAEYRPVNGAVDTEKTTRFKLAPPRPEPTPPTDAPALPSPEPTPPIDIPAPTLEPTPPIDAPAPAAPEPTLEQDFQAPPSVEQPKSWEPEPLEDWEPPLAEPAEFETAEFETAKPEIARPEFAEPEIAEPEESQPNRTLES